MLELLSYWSCNTCFDTCSNTSVIDELFEIVCETLNILIIFTHKECVFFVCGGSEPEAELGKVFHRKIVCT